MRFKEDIIIRYTTYIPYGIMVVILNYWIRLLAIVHNVCGQAQA